MELICTNSKHDSEMKPTSPKFSHTIQDPSRGPVFPFPTLEATKKKNKQTKTGAEMRPAIATGIVIGDAPVSYWSTFSLSLVTVPEVFMKVK